LGKVITIPDHIPGCKIQIGAKPPVKPKPESNYPGTPPGIGHGNKLTSGVPADHPMRLCPLKIFKVCYSKFTSFSWGKMGPLAPTHGLAVGVMHQATHVGRCPSCGFIGIGELRAVSQPSIVLDLSRKFGKK
jgi:hypothetical protein